MWTDVLEPYGTAASADKPLAVFGALSFWWMGEHGKPRIDTSDQVWFANDQLAVRFLEEIDFDYCAIDATAAQRRRKLRAEAGLNRLLAIDDSRAQGPGRSQDIGNTLGSRHR